MQTIILFTIFKLPIINLVTLPPLFYITIVFIFSWDDCNKQEKFETMVIHFFGRGGGGRWEVNVTGQNNIIFRLKFFNKG